MTDDPKTLVSTEWLAAHLNDPDLRILDASYYLPGMSRDAQAEYNDAHIPGARRFDIDDVSDARSELPHMVPPVEKFISRMRAMGVGDGHQVVVYDGIGMFSAPRVWWLFKLMGKTDIAVLDGGFPKWQDMPPIVRDRHITVQRQAHMVKDVTQVASASKLGDWQVVDARANARFKGEAPEPREGLRAGHIPNSINLPFTDLLKPGGTMRDLPELKQIITAAGVDMDKPIITSCGSGVTAAVISLALERLGHKKHALYDGSWAEWGSYPELKIETGS
jgi:thiosulfate/3-mercaptopyruvate sulfurtransferase